MTLTLKKILTIGSAAAIIGIGGVAFAGMGYGYHMDGYNGGHMGYYNSGYGHMNRGDHMYGNAGYCRGYGGGYMFRGDDDHRNYRQMNRDMYRNNNGNHSRGGSRIIDENEKYNNTK